MNEFSYIGTELEVFAEAKNWKNYLKFCLRKYISGNVLEVGAGIGSNTVILSNYANKYWLCLEPDTHLFSQLQDTIKINQLSSCEAKKGTIDNLSEQHLFETILYLDVLEHIEEDKQEVLKAVEHLSFGGHLIIVGPAHQWLFTPFDAAIGHYRRYNKTMLKAIIPPNIEIIKLIYLDCVGLLASLANKLVLKQSKPTLKQVKTWDNLMVPLSKKLDPLLGYNLGKSIILIGRKI